MPDIQHSIQIAGQPAAVYPLIATAGGFRQWWAADVNEPEGAVELGFFNRTTIYRVRLTTTQAPAEAGWKVETGDEWNGTRLIFRLAPGGSGTILRFMHAGWASQTDYFISCNTTWGELMFRLKAAAEGKAPGPLFSADGMAY